MRKIDDQIGKMSPSQQIQLITTANAHRVAAALRRESEPLPTESVSDL